MALPDDHTIALLKTIQNTSNEQLRDRWAYYRGEVPAPYVTEKIRGAFGGLAESFVENYCSIAIDARIDRLEITGFDGPGEGAAEQMWLDGGYQQRQDQMFRWALVEGAMYLVVQDDQVVANPARVCYAQPSTNDWLNVSWAGKVWQDGTRWKATLWDEEEIYYYETEKGAASEWTNQRSWNAATVASALQYTGQERHGYSQVPVFPCNPYGDMAAPLIDRIAPVQDRINKIITNQFVVLEWSAFKQRVFFTRQDLDPWDVRQEPDSAIILDPGDADAKASVVELGGSEIGGYDAIKDKTIHSLFTIANLPRHMLVNPGVNVSGEAIKADEGPFVSAIHNHQREFGQAFAAALALCGIQAEPVWKDPETRNDQTAAKTVMDLVTAGIPWQTGAMRYLGFTPQEIQEATVLAQAQQQQTNSATFDALQAQTTAFLTNPLL